VSGSIKVFLMGASDHKGWALGTDLAMTRLSLAAVPGVVEVATAGEADVVHSMWEYALLTSDPQRFEGKRVLCTFCNDVLRTHEQACMIHARDVVGLWIAMSRKAEQDARALRLPVVYLPQTISPVLFTAAPPPGESRRSLRQRFGLPEQAYVISSFMRDSLGSNLLSPKPQKGVEMWLEIVSRLHSGGYPVHALLAGPRRHWLRHALRTRGVPYTFIGREIPGDDNEVNILDPASIHALYHASDLHLVTSRWEGGPRAVLEAAATRTRIVSTPQGLAPDVLDPACLFNEVDAGVKLVAGDIRSGTLQATLDAHQRRVDENHTPAASVRRYVDLYATIDQVAPCCRRKTAARKCRKAAVPAQGLLGRVRAQWSAYRQRRWPGTGLTVGLWHEFHKPPYGGGNQFMLALKSAMERLGVTVLRNRMSDVVDVHLCNSAWFATDLLDGASRDRKIRMIHRIDGPVGVYRGTGSEEDDRIYELNSRYASATVLQSAYSFKKSLELGYQPRRPVIIHNAVAGRYFHSHGRVPFNRHRKIRLISTSWSDNPRKGGPFYKELEEMLDWDRFEYTFVGRTQQQFTRIRHLPAQPSRQLARILRDHDIYITASRNESCSNALIEALACGLPAVYRNDGSNGELTMQGGLPFQDSSDALGQIERIAAEYEAFQSCIWVASMDDIARRYVDLAQAVIEDDPR
jgi:glycosyltransferase involved in cell wall biosynthesis